MKLLRLFNISLIATLALIAFFSVNVHAAPASFPSAPLTITLTNPTQGQIIVSSGLSFAGKAPTGVIVTITIQDEDYQKAFQVHEANLIINGTTTSDRNGDWVYVPSKNLVPGRYSIVSAFQNDNNGSISSEKIFFTVADETGATSWFSIPGVTLVLIIIVVIVTLLFIIFKVTNGRKRTFLLHTTAGDIPVREIIDENNNVEIVPISQPMINLGPPQTFVQPVYVQPQQVYAQPQQYAQPNQVYVQPVQQNVQQPIVQPAPVIQPAPQQVIAPQPVNAVTVQTRPVQQPIQNLPIQQNTVVNPQVVQPVQNLPVQNVQQANVANVVRPPQPAAPLGQQI